MEKIQFTIEISATKEKVWKVLWDDMTFRQWSDIIDEGTYMRGELKEGNEIEFISGNSGYGVTSLVEKLVSNEYLVLRHKADTQDIGQNLRADEWTGGAENYTLAEKDGLTVLTIEFDIPPEQKEYFQTAFPKAMAKIKQISESI